MLGKRLDVMNGDSGLLVSAGSQGMSQVSGRGEGLDNGWCSAERKEESPREAGMRISATSAEQKKFADTEDAAPSSLSDLMSLTLEPIGIRKWIGGWEAQGRPGVRVWDAAVAGPAGVYKNLSICQNPNDFLLKVCDTLHSAD